MSIAVQAKARTNILRAGCAATAGIAVLGYAFVFAHAMPDDSFIALSFAKNLLLHGEWGLFPGETINTTTSPLNTWLLAAFLFIFKDPIIAVAVCTACLWLGLAFILNAMGAASGNRKLFLACSMGGLLCNPFLLSTLGLETWLFVFLLSCVILCFIKTKWKMTALCLALATLARIDNALLFIVVIFFAPTASARLKISFLYAGCIIPWYLYSWIYLGSLLPETLFIKAAQKTWGDYGFYNGLLLYYSRESFLTALSFLCIFLALGLAASRKAFKLPLVRILVIYAVLHYAAYSALRVPPYLWYYAPEIVSMILAGSFIVAEVQPKAFATRALRAAFIVNMLASPLILAVWIGAKNNIPLKTPLIYANWASCGEYREIASWLKTNVPEDRPIKVMWEMGTLEFYSQRRLYNPFTSRSELFFLIDNVIRPRGFRKSFISLNYLFLNAVPKREDYGLALEYFRKGEPLPSGTIESWPVESPAQGAGFIVYYATGPHS